MGALIGRSKELLARIDRDLRQTELAERVNRICESAAPGPCAGCHDPDIERFDVFADLGYLINSAVEDPGEGVNPTTHDGWGQTLGLQMQRYAPWRVSPDLPWERTVEEAEAIELQMLQDRLERAELGVVGYDLDEHDSDGNPLVSWALLDDADLAAFKSKAVRSLEEALSQAAEMMRSVQRRLTQQIINSNNETEGRSNGD